MKFKNILKRESKSNASGKTRKWKFIATISAIGILILIYSLFLIVRSISNWFDNNQLVFQRVIEIKIQAPIVVEPRKMLSPVPEATKSATQVAVPEVKVQEVKVNTDLDLVVEFISYQESKNGQAPSGHHKYCESKGMTNNYGYAVASRKCFESEGEAVATVKNWLERSLTVRGFSNSLCRYNLGYPLDDCDYYQAYVNYALRND